MNLVRRACNAALDLLARSIPDPEPIRFDEAYREAAAHRRAERAHRGIFRDGRVEWDTPVPYLPTGKSRA